MTEATIKIKEARVLTGHGTDKIYLVIEGENPFKAFDDEPCLLMEVVKGYGEEYCRRNFNIEPLVINVKS